MTDAYQDVTQLGADFNLHTFSDSKDFVVGAIVELHLPFHLGVEADALYRPLHFSSEATGSATLTSGFSESVSSWEFPILAKYHFTPALLAKPYIDAGPAFRAAGANGGLLSDRGFAIGGGIDCKVLFLRISPEIRYTHWGSDANNNGLGPDTLATSSNQNQFEFLTGFSF